MSLREVYQMYLTKNQPNSKLCDVKTIACEAVQVNEGNDKNARSPSRSPNKLLNNKTISLSGERENEISRAHVGNFFLYLSTPILFTNTIVFIFFNLLRARDFFIHSFTFENKINKNSLLSGERLKKLVHSSFPSFT